MNKTIIIFGGDGYIGWPLAMKVALTYPDHKIIIVDNLWRRKAVKSLGYDTLVPIASTGERIAAFAEAFKQNNILYLKADVNSKETDELIRTEKPSTIFHLAHQPSGPYSMKGVEEAIFTLENNESGNMRLMWAVKQHAPETHIIKLSTMGQYAHAGIDIPEGYYVPEKDGKKGNKEVLFHREAEDVYHISKMNDTNYNLMACRKWGLRITDIMQATVFGVRTPEMDGNAALNTRFDYDDIFGTVLNRFVTQVIYGYPMTIYGTGHQRTGLMALPDVVNSFVKLIDDVPAQGKHRIINHVTEKTFSINELADAVKEVAEKNNYYSRINREHDPRMETDLVKKQHNINTPYLDVHLKKTDFKKVLEETFNFLCGFKTKINEDYFHPGVQWSTSNKESRNIVSDIDEEDDVFNIGDSGPGVMNEPYWEAFRKENFPTPRINLNPGTLGALSTQVIKAMNNAAFLTNLNANPLGTYSEFEKKLNHIISLCGEIWNAPEFEVSVTHSITQVMNLLCLSMLRALHKLKKPPYKVVTTVHEHPGGIGGFEQLPEYEVHYIDDTILHDEAALEEKIAVIQPDVCFISHVYYDTGNLCPVDSVCKVILKQSPKCRIILDAAQSLGLYPLPTGDADVIVSSVHKWLFGPHGGGIVWIKKDFAQWIGGLYNSGQKGVSKSLKESLKNKGGLDFEYYDTIAEALKLYQQVGIETALNRSCYLAAFFLEKLKTILDKRKIRYQCFQAEPSSPVISVAFMQYDPYPLYQYLHQQNIHLKCIKNRRIGDKVYHILRIGFPYYESLDRLQYAISEIDYFVGKQYSAVRLSAQDFIN